MATVLIHLSELDDILREPPVVKQQTYLAEPTILITDTDMEETLEDLASSSKEYEEIVEKVRIIL
jgi:hypothetical protein